jgi:DNA polymerase sigma
MGARFSTDGTIVSLSLLCVAEQLKRRGFLSIQEPNKTKQIDWGKHTKKKVKMALRGTCSEIVVRRAAQPKSGPGDLRE